MERVFGRLGILAGAMPDYESRPGQQKMAEAIAAALAGDASEVSGPESSSRNAHIQVIEAETGIGKTLAYLIPAVLSGQKMIISTGTLNLQDQILNKEIPFIQQHIDKEFTALCVKGRQNYLCLYRFKQFVTEEQRQLFGAPAEMDSLRAWSENTETGDRSELDWLPDNSMLWRQISATGSQCLGSHCPFDSDCFVNRMRKKAAAFRLVIVNHHLFFSDLALRATGHGEVLPRYESVIFDEAHHLETVATTYFGTSFSHYQVLDLISDIDKLARADLSKAKRKKIGQAAGLLAAQAEHFAGLFPDRRGKFSLHEVIVGLPQWEAEVQGLADRLQQVQRHLEEIRQGGDMWDGLLQRSEELLVNLYRVTSEASSRYEDVAQYNAIRWYERREKTVSLYASPVEIAGILQESFYSKVRCCIFTSATLSTGAEFTYFLERMGLPPHTDTLRLASPFDYKSRTMLYVPASTAKDIFPQPGDEKFLEKVQQRIYDILMVSRGRALVLFTSISAMQSTGHYLAERLPYPMLLQGEAPRSVLLENFRKQSSSVLLAVASFWEGVDIPGESLSCVIIDKLPFEVPNDPVIMARLDKIRQDGGNPFFDFQIPRAILALRQGVGRLMRASTDSGLLAILDTRLFTKQYGRVFLRSLPASPITRNFSEVEAFFAVR